MKSALELALERTGGTINELPQDQKEKIAEIETKYKAKIAEAELALNERMMKAQGNVAEIDQIQQDWTVELASINSKCEREKEKIRNGAG